MLHSSRPAGGLCALGRHKSRPIKQRLVAVAYTSGQAKQDPALVLQQQQQQAPASQHGVLAAAERLDLDEVWVPYRWPGQLGGEDVYISGSWCEWKERHVSLRHCSASASYPGDWVALFKMKTGQHEYKFNVDGGWRVAPGDPLVMDPEGNINNKRLCVKNCHIEFCFKSNSPVARSPRTVISVIGSWSNWRIATPLQKEGSNKWFTELSLPPGEYSFRFMVGDSTDLHPVMAVSDKYERQEVVNRDGQRVMCNKIRVDVAPAFYLFYATGWRQCTLMYKMLKDGNPLTAAWQVAAMDDSPSRAEPCGENSRWKQAIIALPAGVDASDRDRYSMQFFIQGPRLGDSSDEDNPGGSKDSSRRRSSVRANNGNGNGAQQSAEDAAAARWFAPLPDDGVPGDLRSQVKVDTPDKQSASACYQLRWPGGWKLQRGTITKFPCVTKPPVLLCADIDGTMVNEHSDKKEQFWMDARTKEFQEYWESNAALARSVLVFNTGRSKGQLIWLLKEKPMLAVPDVLITAVGTKIWYLPDGMRCFQDPTEVEWIEDKLWSNRLDEGWDLQQALSAAGEMFKLFNRDSAERVKWLDKGQEHPHRVALQVHTAVLDDLIERLQEAIDKRQLQARIIMSGAGDWRYVDVVHRLAGKLEALEWVRQVYGVPVERCATAGDSCNDILMLDGKMPAIVVGNAQEELVRWYHEQNDHGRIVLTDKPEAAGVLEGLARHGLY